jgi:hypothetical protein
MDLPGIGDYVESLAHPQLFLQDAELKKAQVVRKANGRVRTYSGQFALVAQFEDENNRRWAVRCFTSMLPPDLEERYKAISRFVLNSGIEALVGSEYQPQGIKVQSKWYPICKMEWVDGVTLSDFIKDTLSDPLVLNPLASRFAQTINHLQNKTCSHGDLQHGNIMIDKTGVKLVDYDNMYVPDFNSRNMKAVGDGHRHYRHPNRNVPFDEKLDRFSAISIYLSLKLLAKYPERFPQNGEELLFREEDYKQPKGSENFQLLKQAGYERAAEQFADLCIGDPKNTPLLTDFIKEDAVLAEAYEADAEQEMEFKLVTPPTKKVTSQPAASKSVSAPSAPKPSAAPTPPPTGGNTRPVVVPLPTPNVPPPSWQTISNPVSPVQAKPATTPAPVSVTSIPSLQNQSSTQTSPPPTSSGVIPSTPPSTASTSLPKVVPSTATPKPITNPPPPPLQQPAGTVERENVYSFAFTWVWSMALTLVIIGAVGGAAASATAMGLQLAPKLSNLDLYAIPALFQELLNNVVFHWLFAAAVFGGLGAAFAFYPQELLDETGKRSDIRHNWRVLAALCIIPLMAYLVNEANNMNWSEFTTRIAASQTFTYGILMSGVSAITVLWTRRLWRKIVKFPVVNPANVQGFDRMLYWLGSNLRFYGVCAVLCGAAAVAGTVNYFNQRPYWDSFAIDPLILACLITLAFAVLLYQVPKTRQLVWTPNWLRIVAILGSAGLIYHYLFTLNYTDLPGLFIQHVLIAVVPALIVLLPAQRSLS